jgi:hypothetical protein
MNRSDLYMPKAIPLTDQGGLLGCMSSTIQQFLENRLTDGATVTLMCPLRFNPQKHFLILIPLGG